MSAKPSQKISAGEFFRFLESHGRAFLTFHEKEATKEGAGRLPRSMTRSEWWKLYRGWEAKREQERNGG